MWHTLLTHPALPPCTAALTSPSLLFWGSPGTCGLLASPALCAAATATGIAIATTPHHITPALTRGCGFACECVCASRGRQCSVAACDEKGQLPTCLRHAPPCTSTASAYMQTAANFSLHGCSCRCCCCCCARCCGADTWLVSNDTLMAGNGACCGDDDYCASSRKQQCSSSRSFLYRHTHCLRSPWAVCADNRAATAVWG